MKAYKATWRYYFFLILFSLASILGLRVLYMLMNGQVSDENGEPLDKLFVILTCTIIIVVLLTWIPTCLKMLWQLFKYKSLLTITPNGIENTLVVLYMFAFVIVIPVKLIPWEAVKYYDVVLF